MCPTDVRVALESLPKGLEALSIAYDQAMQRIAAQRPGMRILAHDAMSWITYAKRLLTVVEVRYALGIRHGTSHFDEESLCNIDDIVSACGGLVIVDQGKYRDTVRLVHYSTQEFMRQAGETYFPNAQEHIAVSCLTYLLYDDFDGGWWYESRNRNEEVDRVNRKDYTTYIMDFVQQYPFVVYAAHHWATHASACSEQSVRDAMMQFLSDDYKVSSATQVLLLRPRENAINHGGISKVIYTYELDPYPSQTGNPMSGMHLVAFLGVREIVSMLLANGFAADVRDVFNRSPLFWAALNGHTAVVDLLLSLNDIGLDPISRYDRISSTSAVSGGEIPGVQRLVLHEDVNLNAKDSPDQKGPASRAAEDVSLAIVGKNLTPSTVDVNCQDSSGTTPLMVAVKGGHDEVVAQLLKSSNISVHLENREGFEALTYAARIGDEAIVRLLITRPDADVNFNSTHGTAPLYMATLSNHEAVVQTLLSHAEIDVNTKDGSGSTPLITAAYHNNESIARLLLAHRSIDVNCKDSDGMTALLIAANGRHKAMVKLLLTCTGIDLNSKASIASGRWMGLGKASSARYRRHFAASMNVTTHETIMKLLLRRTDIDIDCIDEKGNNLLTRVKKVAPYYSKPGVEGTIALLRAAKAGLI